MKLQVSIRNCIAYFQRCQREIRIKERLSPKGGITGLIGMPLFRWNNYDMQIKALKWVLSKK